MIDTLLLIFLKIEKVFEIDGIGCLRKNLARIFKEDIESPEFSGILFAAEKKINDAGYRPVGVFIKENQQRDKKYGPINGFLHIDKVLDRICFCFYKSSMKTFLFNQGYECGTSIQKLLSDISPLVRIRK